MQEDKEQQILFKYRKGRYVDNEDLDIIRNLCLAGQMRTGFNLTENNIIVPTAKTLQQGLFLLNISTSFFTRLKWWFKYIVK